jgi:crossover junction endodeoxyribonuclease RusA
MSFTVTLPYPISANRYWATRVINPKAGGRAQAMTYVTPEAKAYKERVGWLLKAAGVRAPIEGRVALHVKLYPHRPLDWQSRQRKLGAAWDDTVQCIDLGNAEKVLSDALKGLAFGDDKWLRDIHLQRMEPDGGDARVVVTITAVPSAVVQSDLLGAAA